MLKFLICKVFGIDKNKKLLNSNYELDRKWDMVRDIKITAIYTHISDEQLKEELERL